MTRQGADTKDHLDQRNREVSGGAHAEVYGANLNESF